MLNLLACHYTKQDFLTKHTWLVGKLFKTTLSGVTLETLRSTGT